MTLRTTFCLILLSLSFAMLGQERVPSISFRRGVEIVHPDSAYSIIFRFRMQNRAMFTTMSGTDLRPEEYEARVRRTRLRLEGFMYDPRLTYLLQLSFSRGDMDWSVRHFSAINESPNVVRDACIFYRPNQHWQLTFGQTKLPGNRQRVVSSGELQFIDRSIVNFLFNIDRDFGIQVWYFNNINNLHFNIRTAITGGDGRNVTTTNTGLAYTARAEILPFGRFTNMGDYFEGDLEREQNVKVSVGGGLSINDRANRTGAQIGRDLFQTRDINTYFFDALLKYRGFAMYMEHMARSADNPITATALETRHIITGNGSLIQTSYLFPANIEIAARYSVFRPGPGISTLEDTEHIITGGITRYLRGHRLKLQANISYHVTRPEDTPVRSDFWYSGVQIEMGI